jgi:hypothetical protein
VTSSPPGSRSRGSAGSGHTFWQQLACCVEILLADQHLERTTRARPTRPRACRDVGPPTPALDALCTEQTEERLCFDVVLNLGESDQLHLQERVNDAVGTAKGGRVAPMLEISAGAFAFAARFEEEAAPETAAAFRRMLPLDSKIIHVRWSGEGGWIPMGDLDVGIGPENATSYPSPGELIFYPGGVSETELLLAYGYVAFASKAGALAGNHFATIVAGNENLRELGRRMLWEGAQDIVFTES